MTRIEQHLSSLYGETAARDLVPRIIECWTHYGFQSGTIENNQKPSLSLTQRDALLITYGDQLRKDGEKPLETLRNFLSTQVEGVVSGVHILPFYPYTSDDGFSVTDWFAVDQQLGEWSDIQKLGDNFDLMFDAVFNHLSAKSAWFKKYIEDDPAYRNFFIDVQGDPDLSGVVRPRALPLLTEFPSTSGLRKVWTTFSADQVDLNFKNPEVLLASIRALLFYVKNGSKFIRLDAIAYLWKEVGTSCIHLPQVHEVVQLYRAILDEVAPDVSIITETNVPHVDNISYFGNGSNEAQLVYNFALPPLVLHSLASGDATELSRWASTLQLPSDRTAFFNFLASHDGIGVNPARGILEQKAIDALVSRAQANGGYVSYKHTPDGSKIPYELNISYFDALSNPNNHTETIETQIDRFMVSQAIMLALAGVPGIYFHSLFGSRSDRPGAETSGIPRRINREKFQAVDLESSLADKNSLRSKVFSRYGHLLKIRREQIAFHPRTAQTILDAPPNIFALLRTPVHSKEPVLCLHNVSERLVRFEGNIPGAPSANRWNDLLSGQSYDQADDKICIDLAPYQVIWARLSNS